MPLFSQDAQEAMRSIETGFSEAKKGLQEFPSPSHMLPVIKEVAVAGAGVFRIFNGLDALYSLKQIYDEGLAETPGGVAIQVSRATLNVGIVALSGIAAAIAFGATVVAAPLVGAILGGVTVVKNSLDLLSAHRRGVKLEKKIKEFDEELKKDDIHVSQNIAALNDLAQRQSDIASLMQEHADLKKAIIAFDKANDAEKVQMIKDRKSALEKEISENHEINSFVSKNPKNIMDVNFLKTTIDKTESEVVRKFATQLIDTLQSLNEVKKQIDDLPNKYNKAPFDKLSVKQKTDLMRLDERMLTERKSELQSKVDHLLNSEQRLEKNQKSKVEISSLSNREPDQNNAAFKKNMQERMGQIKENVIDKHQALKERKKYTELFLGKATLDKAPEEIRKALDQKFEKTLDRAKLEGQLTLCQIEKKKKWKNIGLGLAGLGIAIAVCIPPMQALLGLGLIAVGLIGGVNAIYDYKKKKGAQENEKLQKEQLTEAHLAQQDKLSSQVRSSPVLDHLNTFISSPDKPKDSPDHGHDALQVDSTATISPGRKMAAQVSFAPTSASTKEPSVQVSDENRSSRKMSSSN